MITIDDYYKGRDKQYADELTPDIESNALITVDRINQLLDAFYAANPTAAVRTVNSGWRPEAINASVHGAATHSKHMTGQACDLSDDDGQLDAWLQTDSGQAALERIGLWMESPSSTPRWSHCQIVPPGSGKRVFIP